MSVQALDTKVFNYIRSGIELAAYHTTVDEWYYYPITSHFQHRDIETESKRLVNSWCDMNYKSYAGRYKETFETFTHFIDYAETHPKLTPIQLLKFVQCLIYNIEPEHWQLTEQEQADLKLLKNLEMAILTAIVCITPEYKSAAWSEFN